MLLTVMNVLEERLPISEFYFRERNNFKNKAINTQLDNEIKAIASPRMMPTICFSSPKRFRTTEVSDFKFGEPEEIKV